MSSLSANPSVITASPSKSRAGLLPPSPSHSHRLTRKDSLTLRHNQIGSPFIKGVSNAHSLPTTSSASRAAPFSSSRGNSPDSDSSSSTSRRLEEAGLFVPPRRPLSFLPAPSPSQSLSRQRAGIINAQIQAAYELRSRPSRSGTVRSSSPPRAPTQLGLHVSDNSSVYTSDDSYSSDDEADPPRLLVLRHAPRPTLPRITTTTTTTTDNANTSLRSDSRSENADLFSIGGTGTDVTTPSPHPNTATFFDKPHPSAPLPAVPHSAGFMQEGRNDENEQGHGYGKRPWASVGGLVEWRTAEVGDEKQVQVRMRTRMTRRSASSGGHVLGELDGQQAGEVGNGLEAADVKLNQGCQVKGFGSENGNHSKS